LLDNKLEFGPTFGISYSEPKVDFNSTVPDYYYVDVIDIAKASFGFYLYYYANFVDSKYVPFVGLKVKNFFDAKSFLFFLKSGTNNVMEPGFYSFSSKDDYEFSISAGLKIISTENFNILFELEYQHREFTLEYDEYDNNPIGWGIDIRRTLRRTNYKRFKLGYRFAIYILKLKTQFRSIGIGFQIKLIYNYLLISSVNNSNG